MHVSTPFPGGLVLHVSGEVDTLTAPELDVELDRHLGDGASCLVIDLTGVSFLASSGLAVLVKAAHTAEQRGTRLALVTASRAVVRPLEVTRTAELFTIHESLSAAEAAMRPDAAGEG